MRLLTILLTFWSLFSEGAVRGQSIPDSTELKAFWVDNIHPFINKDMNKLDMIVHFPLSGEWGFIMGLNKPESLWTKEDFFMNFDKLFDRSLIEDLRSKSYRDATVYSADNGTIQIHVDHHWMTADGFEKGIILRFEQIQDRWRLISIQAVG